MTASTVGFHCLVSAKAPAVLSSNTFANDKKVGPGQTVRFKTAIQYLSTLNIAPVLVWLPSIHTQKTKILADLLMQRPGKQAKQQVQPRLWSYPFVTQKP